MSDSSNPRPLTINTLVSLNNNNSSSSNDPPSPQSVRSVNSIDSLDSSFALVIDGEGRDDHDHQHHRPSNRTLINAEHAANKYDEGRGRLGDIDDIGSARSLTNSPLPQELLGPEGGDNNNNDDRYHPDGGKYHLLKTAPLYTSLSRDEWRSTINSLIIRYPVMPTIQQHMIDFNDGKSPVPAECCSSAAAILEASVLAAEKVNGFAGVMNQLYYSFGWGPYHLSHLCQSLTSAAKRLDCGSSAVMAVHTLRLSQSVRSGQMIACGVQMLMQGSFEECERHSNYFSRKGADSKWISPAAGVQYHQVVGVIQPKTKQLFIWDWGKWRNYPAVSIDQPHAILALRIDPIPYQLYQPRFPSINKSNNNTPAPFPSFVRFGILNVPVNQWFTMLPNSLRLSNTIPNFPSALKDNDGGGNAWLSNDFLNYCHSAGQSNWIIQNRDTPIYNTLGGVNITVYVSGIMMNDDNVAPGIGVGRCLRNRFASPKTSLPAPIDSALAAANYSFNFNNHNNNNSTTSSTTLPSVFARIVGVDYGIESAGLNESSFDAILCIQALISTKAHQHYQQIRRRCGYSTNDPTSPLASVAHGYNYWIPCSDVETHMISKSIKECGLTAQQNDRLLVPPMKALETILKPCVPAGKLLDMDIPPFALIDDSEEPAPNSIDPDKAAKGEQFECGSLMEIQRFCLLHGYPVYVKGIHFGAALCYNWSSVEKSIRSFKAALGQPVYVQSAITGWGKGIAFAAYKGQLTAALTLTKTGITGLKKGWSGHLGSVAPDLYEKLERFCQETEWTGGGEVEYLEELDGRRWLIDFNPRFPAYIFASVHAGANLPGALVQHALHASIPHIVPFPTIDAAAASQADCHYTRTIIEVPAPYMTPVLTGGPEVLPGHEDRIRSSRVIEMSKALHRGDQNNNSNSAAGGGIMGGAGGQNKKEKDDDDDDDNDDEKENKDNSNIPKVEKKTQEIIKSSSNNANNNNNNTKKKHSSSILPMLPPAISSIPLRSSLSSSANALSLLSDTLRRTADKLEPLGRSISADYLKGELSFICPNSIDIQRFTTPCFLLSRRGIHHAISRIRSAIDNAALVAKFPYRTQLCVSVKTQPARGVLELAKQEGLLAEVISFAELRAALAIGYKMGEIVVNGPAKFVDHHPIDPSLPVPPPPKEPLACVFADSLAELEIIIQCIKDPNHWMKSSIVGVRLCSAPLGSRFGVKMEPGVLRQLSALLSTLPSDISIGFHFHYASAFLGVQPWAGYVYAFLRQAFEIGLWSGRSIKIIDFGGGSSPNLFCEGVTQKVLQSILSVIPSLFPALETVYFEPGKALTERSGSLLMTVQHIRELKTMLSGPSNGGREDSSMLDGISWPRDRDPIPASKMRVGAKGAVVDGCICDIGSFVTHPHPLLWLNQDKKKVAQENQRRMDSNNNDNKDNTTTNNNNHNHNHHNSDEIDDGEWEVLEGGKDIVLGRICMEFDMLGSGIKFPSAMKEGDKLLLAYTGAYDMSMSYDFGRGAGLGNAQEGLNGINKSNNTNEALPGAIPYHFLP